MRHATAKLEQFLARIAVGHVLPHRVIHRLLGEAVFQFKSGDWQAVDKKPHIQRKLRLIPAHAAIAGLEPAGYPAAGERAASATSRAMQMRHSKPRSEASVKPPRMFAAALLSNSRQ